MRVEQTEQVAERAARRQVAAVRAEMHPGDDDLPEPGGGDCVELGRHAGERRAPPAAAR